jgi:L-amino acid N-acyltransferase
VVRPRLLSISITLREARPDDLEQLLAIYNDAVLNTAATFDLKPVTFEARANWLSEHDMHYPLLTAVVGGSVAGYCSLSPYAKKAGYLKTVELSVYVGKRYRRKGIATALMEEIIRRAKRLGYHAIVSSISGSNYESIELHRKLGFTFRGQLKHVGLKFGQWQDVSLYELLL